MESTEIDAAFDRDTCYSEFGISLLFFFNHRNNILCIILLPAVDIVVSRFTESVELLEYIYIYLYVFEDEQSVAL